MHNINEQRLNAIKELKTLDELKTFLDEQDMKGKYRTSEHIQEQFENAFEKGNEIGVVFFTEKECHGTRGFSIRQFYVDSEGNERTIEEYQMERGVVPK